MESKNSGHNYMLLSRLQMDCDYFLGYGQRAVKHLWAGSVEEQIKTMKELYNSFTEKPQWITFEDIEDYERKMLAA